MLNPLNFKEFDNDQRRELVNTQQRYRTWREAKLRVLETRGSMTWLSSKGSQYLVRSYYNKSGARKQRSLGKRSPDTEALRASFVHGRDQARARFKDIDTALNRQAAINRAIALGRVPMMSAQIIRALDETGSLGTGIRVVGTNALYAYEAAAGVMIDSGLTTTGDIDLLFDSRGGLKFVVSDDVPERSLMRVLRDVDRTFEQTAQPFRAENSEGYLVDLIKPMRNPPWLEDKRRIGDNSNEDLAAAEIEGLIWLENSPKFEATAIDERGTPLRIVAADPRVWATHKLWISKRVDRDPVKRRRDEQQARVVGALVAGYLDYLPFVADELKMMPRSVVKAAAHLFVRG